MAAMRLRWHKWWLIALAGTACTLNPQPDLPLGANDSSGAGASGTSGSGVNTSTGSGAAGASAGGGSSLSVPTVGEAGATEGAAEAGANGDAGASGDAPIVAR
jgi:hypothetical protein